MDGNTADQSQVEGNTADQLQVDVEGNWAVMGAYREFVCFSGYILSICLFNNFLFLNSIAKQQVNGTIRL